MEIQEMYETAKAELTKASRNAGKLQAQLDAMTAERDALAAQIETQALGAIRAGQMRSQEGTRIQAKREAELTAMTAERDALAVQVDQLTRDCRRIGAVGDRKISLRDALAAQTEELAGLHRQLHGERSKIGPWDLEAIGAIRARIERLTPDE